MLTLPTRKAPVIDDGRLALLARLREVERRLGKLQHSYNELLCVAVKWKLLATMSRE